MVQVRRQLPRLPHAAAPCQEQAAVCCPGQQPWPVKHGQVLQLSSPAMLLKSAAGGVWGCSTTGEPAPAPAAGSLPLLLAAGPAAAACIGAWTGACPWKNGVPIPGGTCAFTAGSATGSILCCCAAGPGCCLAGAGAAGAGRTVAVVGAAGPGCLGAAGAAVGRVACCGCCSFGACGATSTGAGTTSTGEAAAGATDAASPGAAASPLAVGAPAGAASMAGCSGAGVLPDGARFIMAGCRGPGSVVGPMPGSWLGPGGCEMLSLQARQAA